jgi:NAD(P)-dependent dehydrogenase (short-subunit alcohol dehydrogenase family)
MDREKRCVVTGATGGIGRWIALGMARAGYRVVMVGRDHRRGEAAQAWISGQLAEARLETMTADLASLADTAALGRAIAARHGRVDALILNAGVFRTRRQVTAEGHEAVLAVNHLSPFVLIRELEAALTAAAPARIVMVGSSTSDRATIRPDDLELARGWGMQRAYAQSKLAVMMTTFEWARRLQPARVTANVVHPGLVATGLVRAPGAVGLAWRLMQPFARTPEDGARTPLFAALAEEHAATTGQYLKDCRILAPNPLARDATLRDQVWQATERLVPALRHILR